MTCRCFFASAIVPLLLTAALAEPQKKPAHKPAPQAVESSAKSDREGIEALQKADITAAMGFDVDRWLDLWTSDGVLLPPRHQPVVGKAALRSFLEEKKEQYANYDMLAYDEQWDEVMTSGSYTYQWGTVTFRMKPPVGGEISGAVRTMRVLKRDEDGAWRVARAIWNEALPALPAPK